MKVNKTHLSNWVFRKRNDLLNYWITCDRVDSIYSWQNAFKWYGYIQAKETLFFSRKIRQNPSEFIPYWTHFGISNLFWNFLFAFVYIMCIDLKCYIFHATFKQSILSMSIWWVWVKYAIFCCKKSFFHIIFVLLSQEKQKISIDVKQTKLENAFRPSEIGVIFESVATAFETSHFRFHNFWAFTYWHYVDSNWFSVRRIRSDKVRFFSRVFTMNSKNENVKN